MKLQIGIVGCGSPGRGRARSHLKGFLRDDCEVVALCDIVPENAGAFAQEYSLTEARLYTDYRAMFQTEKLDMIGVCLWPHLHAPVTIAAAEAGVRAVLCEKPIAPTWGESKRMAVVCREHGTQLSFSHQRRFGAPFRQAKALIDSGEIGQLQSFDGYTYNLYDWGTHWFDMMQFFNHEEPADWVLAQLDWRGAKALFGVPLESQGIAHFRYQNGVRGTMVTSQKKDDWFGLRIRANGTKGVVEVGDAAESDGSQLRILKGDGWQPIATETGIHDEEDTTRAIADAIDALESGREPLLGVDNALRGTELMFAAYESARQQKRIQLPLEFEGHALIEILRDNNALPEGVLV